MLPPYIHSTLYVPPMIHTHVIYTTYNTHHPIYYSLYVSTLYMPIDHTHAYYIATLCTRPYNNPPLCTHLVCAYDDVHRAIHTTIHNHTSYMTHTRRIQAHRYMGY